MNSDVGEDVPGDDLAPPADAGAQANEESAAEEVQTAWTPNKLKKAERRRLSDNGYAMVSGDADLEWIFRGAKEATLEVLQRAFQHLQAFYDTLRADEQVTGLRLAHSVHVWIGPSESEVDAAERALEQYEEEVATPQAKPKPRPPTKTEARREKAKRDRMARQFVPNTVLANSVILELIGETTDEDETDPRAAALRYGAGVASRLRAIVKQLADDGLDLEVGWTLDDRRVEASADRLSKVAEALGQPGTPSRFRVSVAGTLRMADADKLQFRLRFASDVPRPDVLREWRKGTITGTFTRRMQQSLTERQLWNQEVIAQLEVTREERGTSAARSKPRVRLTAARARSQ